MDERFCSALGDAVPVAPAAARRFGAPVLRRLWCDRGSGAALETRLERLRRPVRRRTRGAVAAAAAFSAAASRQEPLHFGLEGLGVGWAGRGLLGSVRCIKGLFGAAAALDDLRGLFVNRSELIELFDVFLNAGGRASDRRSPLRRVRLADRAPKRVFRERSRRAAYDPCAASRKDFRACAPDPERR